MILKIKHLQNLGKERQDYSVRVIEENGSDIINSWINDIEVGGTRLSQGGHVLRGFIQILLIATAAWIGGLIPIRRLRNRETFGVFLTSSVAVVRNVCVQLG